MYAVVPIKALSMGKQRLSGFLSHDERAGLSLAMASDVLQAIRDSDCCDKLFICAGDPETASLACRFDAELILDRQLGASGLNEVCAAVATHFKKGDVATLLLAHGDLPALQNQDLQDFALALQDHDLAIAADRHGQGSNLLAWHLRHPFTPQFGEGSFQRHCQQAQGLGLRYACYGLGSARWDIDQADDLLALVKGHGGQRPGSYTQRFLDETGIVQRCLRQRPSRAPASDPDHETNSLYA